MSAHTVLVRISYTSERPISNDGIEVVVVKSIMDTYASGITSIVADVVE